MKSIRASVTVPTAVFTLAMSTLISVALFTFFRGLLVADYKETIENDLNTIANVVKVWTDGDVYVELNTSILTGFAAGGDRAFIVRDATGRRIIEESMSLSVADRLLAAAPNPQTDAFAWDETVNNAGETEIVATRIMPAQWGWDLDDLSIQVRPDVRETMVEITVARSRAALDQDLTALTRIMMGIVAISTIFAAVGGWIGTTVALLPLGHLAKQANEIETPADDRPFDTAGPSELKPIAERLNNLLTRLHATAQRENRFTADAAHELRTPIAELRTLTDVALAFPDDTERLNKVVQTSNDLAVRLTSLVDALLGIARRDSLVAAQQAQQVDIPVVLREIVAKLQDLASERRLTVTLDIPDHHEIMTDPALLEAILRNLLDNAHAYAPEGSCVQVFYSGGSNGFRLDVTNPVVGLEQADTEKLFEPFWRSRGSHTDSNHSGLGLTLAQSFAEILGLRLTGHLLCTDKIQFTLTSA